MQILAEIFFWPKIFLSSIFIIFNEDVTRVIDTQPIGTSAIIKAIRCYNKFVKKNLLLEKVMIDLPTKRSTHYFKNIKKLSSKDRDLLKIVTLKPLLEEEKTEEDFWKKHCNISLDKIIYEKFIVRESFKKHTVQKQKKDVDIELRMFVQKDRELNWISKAYCKSFFPRKIKKNSLKFKIKKEDKLITLLLGSEPAVASTLKYVEKFILTAKKFSKDVKYYMFVFCANEISLFQNIYSLIQKEKNILKNIHIVPMTFQDDSVIAPLFFRSDITITRSGGSTIMELLSVAKKENWIHSEGKEHALIKGIPFWEAGNAMYLQNFVGAKLVTPNLFSQFITQIF